LVHDAIKYGFSGGKHTSKTHESEGAFFFEKATSKLLGASVPLPLYQKIRDAIAWHQGRWSTSEGAPKFPDGFSKLAQVVHIADMVASRKEVRFNFNENIMIG
jgi:hypothetical protein